MRIVSTAKFARIVILRPQVAGLRAPDDESKVCSLTAQGDESKVCSRGC